MEILQVAKEKYPDARPRIISDNGPQFIAKDFKEFIRISGMTHVRTSPFYPQSNGKTERWHKSLKGECIRLGTPLSLDDAQRLVQGYVDRYNDVRLNSAVGYITPKDMLTGGNRRSTRSATGSSRRPGNSGRFVASKPLDGWIALCWAEARRLNFRVADQLDKAASRRHQRIVLFIFAAASVVAIHGRSSVRT